MIYEKKDAVVALLFERPTGLTLKMTRTNRISFGNDRNLILIVIVDAQSPRWPPFQFGF